MATLTLRQLTKRYPGGAAGVEGVSLDVRDGELLILVGPSGCGKSTLLRMIAGLEDISSGELLIDGERVNEQAPRERGLAMVFQSYALYPHLTAFENIAFPLRIAGRPEAEVRRRVEETAQLLDLGEFLARRPSQLSGGQRQRVAMGRAIVREARAFLFDEPLSNLDAKLRGQMRTEIARLQRRLAVTTIYVTHDQTEALTLGDRVAVLRRGTLQQVAEPRELYERPSNLFVAGFIGSPPMNFLLARPEGGELVLPFARVALAPERAARLVAGNPVVAGVRPEHFEDAALVSAEARSRGLIFRARVDAIEWLGSEQLAYLPLDMPPAEADRLRSLARAQGSELVRPQLVVSLDPASRLRVGAEAELWLDPRRMQLFDPESGENLASSRTRAQSAWGSPPGAGWRRG